MPVFKTFDSLFSLNSLTSERERKGHLGQARPGRAARSDGPPILPKMRCEAESRKVDATLPGKKNPNSHGARPIHLIITVIKWIRTRRL